MDLSTRLARFAQADLYVVITEAFCAGRSGLDVLDACLRAGVRLVQFLRPDAKFDGLEALKAAIEQDALNARAALA
jgi:thiamine monophosphate synthase